MLITRIFASYLRFPYNALTVERKYPGDIYAVYQNQNFQMFQTDVSMFPFKFNLLKRGLEKEGFNYFQSYNNYKYGTFF